MGIVEWLNKLDERMGMVGPPQGLAPPQRKRRWVILTVCFWALAVLAFIDPKRFAILIGVQLVLAVVWRLVVGRWPYRSSRRSN